MSLNKAQHGDPWGVTATDGTASLATKSGVAGKIHYITDICVSSDKANAKFAVKQGSTTIWQGQLLQTAAGISVWSQKFEIPLAGIAGGDVSITIDSTSYGSANIAGFTL